MAKFEFKPIYYWFAIFALTFVAYQQITDNIRPYYSGGNAVIIYFLGIAPNFFPAVGIPALFVILLPELGRSAEPAKWLREQRHISANLISVVGLIAWEFVQMSRPKAQFDWNDVLWTFVGAAVFQLLWTVSPAKYKAS